MAGTRDFGNFRFFKNVRVPFFKNPQKMVFWKCPPLSGSIFSKTRKQIVFEKIQIFDQLPGSKIPLLAIHKIISHIWEDGSQKGNNDEPDLRFCHGNFWPVISHAVRNLVFRPQSQGGQICVSWISRRRRRRRRTNSQIQIQAPPNASRDEILLQGNPRCWLCLQSSCCVLRPANQAPLKVPIFKFSPGIWRCNYCTTLGLIS